MATEKPRVYWDEARQKWMVDDHGRPREASSEEVEQAREEGRL